MKGYKRNPFGKQKLNLCRCKEVKKYAKGNNYCRSQPKRRYGKNYHK